MSTLDIAMLIIAIVFAVVVGLQVVKLVKAIKDKKAHRANIEHHDEGDEKGE